GIGGSGMSALALLLQARGWTVRGSDRSRDRGETPDKFAALGRQGFELCPQDGSGVTGADLLIVSSAVEDTIPDVRAAKEKGIPIRKRADMLAEMSNAAEVSIGIAGTSGKSTTTAMTGWILSQAGKNPTIANGAHMANFNGANAVTGGVSAFVAEVDESDGSIALFNPAVAVVTNMSLDHKPMAELRTLFADYISRAKTAIINLDDPETLALGQGKPHVRTFAVENPTADFHACDIMPLPDGVSFTVKGIPVMLRVPGRHNVANALAAMAAAEAAGVSVKDAAQALGEYRGIKRRFEIIGTANGVTVIDDFAHNPDKIAATLRALHEHPGRVLAFFQPHGFGPTKLMRADLVATLGRELGRDDILFMPEIYYAGGTATRDISSADIVADVTRQGRSARFFPTRAEIAEWLATIARLGDRIVIMGARDDTLSVFANDVLQKLHK
ncbi:MAG TPA: Mur ligase family protein, partial [Alphaproteobacteria bacterium]